MKNILLIEDDETFHGVLRDVLELRNYKVTSAFNGMQGLKLFEKTTPDLIITDIIMPEMDGFTLIGYITKRKNNKFPCKVIAMSGGGCLDRDRCLDVAKFHGADETLGKPFSLLELEQKVDSLLSH